MMFRRSVMVALVALPLAATAACGGGASPQVASLGSDSSSPSAAPTRSMAAYVECMRSKGVQMDDKGAVLTTQGSGGLQTLPSNFGDAQQACESLQPQQTAGGSNADAQATNMKLAACMRTNGVTDWPDPVAGDPKPNAAGGGGMVTATAGGGTSSFQLPPSIDLGSPRVKKAMAKCQGGTGMSFGTSAGVAQ